MHPLKLLFNIIIYIQSQDNGGLQGKFYMQELEKPVMEMSSITSAGLSFWFVQVQDVTSVAFWSIYFPCLQPDPKYLQIFCLYKREDTEISFCPSVTNTLGALGLLVWTPWPHNVSEIVAFPGYHWSLDTFPPRLISEMPIDILECSTWTEKLELVVCWKADHFSMCSVVWFAITCLC